MSDLTSQEDDDLDPRELIAARWIVRRDHGFSPAERREFEAWLEADPENRAAFARLDTTWVKLERVEPAAVLAPPDRRPRRLWLAGLAAAAAIALLVQFETRDAGGETEWIREIATDVGKRESVALPDGSRIELNTASGAAVRYTAHERRVELTAGEGTFAVARDPARPFVVRVDGLEVRAIGTAFAVRRQDGSVDVLVTEGRVQLAKSSGPAERPVEVAQLGARQRASVALAAHATPSIETLEPAAVARALGWREGRLEFREQPLAEILVEFNRYRERPLVVEDPELAQERFGGRFPIDDPEALVRMLELTFGVQAERGAEAVVLRRRGSGARAR